MNQGHTKLVWRLDELRFEETPIDLLAVGFMVFGQDVYLHTQGVYEQPKRVRVGPKEWFGSVRDADMMIAKALQSWVNYRGERILVPKATRKLRDDYEVFTTERAEQKKLRDDVPSLSHRLGLFKELKRRRKYESEQAAEATKRAKMERERLRRWKADEQNRAAQRLAIQNRRKPLIWPGNKLRRSNVDWGDYVPQRVVLAQVSWERGQTATVMRATGMTLAAIGDRFDLSRERIRQMLAKAERISRWGSPVERYFSEREIFHSKEKKHLLEFLPKFSAPRRDWLLVA